MRHTRTHRTCYSAHTRLSCCSVSDRQQCPQKGTTAVHIPCNPPNSPTAMLPHHRTNQQHPCQIHTTGGSAVLTTARPGSCLGDDATGPYGCGWFMALAAGKSPGGKSQQLRFPSRPIACKNSKAMQSKTMRQACDTSTPCLLLPPTRPPCGVLPSPAHQLHCRHHPQTHPASRRPRLLTQPHHQPDAAKWRLQGMSQQFHNSRPAVSSWRSLPPGAVFPMARPTGGPGRQLVCSC
jgi:hypothetical protein